MPIDESVPDQQHNTATPTPPGWTRTLSTNIIIGVIIAVLVSAAGGYQIGRMPDTTPMDNQNTSFLTSTSPAPTPMPQFFVGPSIGKSSPNPSTTPFPTAAPRPTVFVSYTFYPLPTTTPTLTADWKTYTSDKYEYSFQYPPDLHLNVIPCQKGYECDLEMVTVNKQPIPQNLNKNDIMSYEGQEYITRSLRLVITLDPQDKRYEWVGTGGSGAKYESIGVGGKIGHIIWKDDIPAETRKRRLILKIPLKEENNRMIYLHVLYHDDERTTIPLDEFHRILSTFTFSDAY